MGERVYYSIIGKKREQEIKEHSRIKQRENEIKKAKCLKCRTYCPGFGAFGGFFGFFVFFVLFFLIKHWTYIYQNGIEVHGINVILF